MNKLRRALSRLDGIAAASYSGLKAWVMSWAGARYGWDWITRRSRYDYKGAVGDGTGNSAVMAPILWFARTWPEARLTLYRVDTQGEREEQAKHPLMRLLKRPNPYYSGSLMWMATATSLLVAGNAYWLKVRNSRGQIVELWWTPATLIRPTWNEDGSGDFITHYEYTPGTKAIDVPVADVVHFRYGIDPQNVRLGLSPLASVLREVFTDDETNNFTGAILRNLGIPGLIISPDSGGATISSEDAKATKEYVAQEFGGDNRGAPLVFRGPTRAQVLSWNPQQMALREIYRKAEERITAVLGIPAIVAGLGAGLDRSTFANFSEAREAAYETTLIPVQSLAAEDAEVQLLPDFEPNVEDWTLAYDYSEVRVLQEDLNKKYIRLGAGVRDGWITPATAQREAGLPVDETQHVYLRPQNIVEIPAESAERPLSLPPAAVQPSLSSGGLIDEDLSLEAGRIALNIERLEALGMIEEAEAERERLMRLIATAPKAGSLRRRMGRKASAEDVALLRRLAASTREAESRFATRLVSRFDVLGALAAQAFTRSTSGKAGYTSLVVAGNGAGRKQDESIDEDVSAVMSALQIASWAETELLPEYTRHYQDVGRLTYGAISERLGLEVAWNLDDPVVREIIRRGGTRLGLLDIEGETRDALFRALADGRAAGEGADALARRIREYVPAGPYRTAGVQYRAETIARTETKYAQNISSLAAYRSTDVVIGVIAFDNQTGYNDADCTARNGTVYDLDEAARVTEREHPRGTLNWAPMVRP
jgi:HK97 family phage portal protein